MLDKSLCIQCYDRHWKTKWGKQPSKERLWARGLLCCPEAKVSEWGVYWKIERGPPDDCTFHLEQIMACGNGIRAE